MTEKQEWFKGETYGKILIFEDDSDTQVDPTSVTITIKTPSGTTQDTLSMSDLTKVETGKYKMFWDIPADAETGVWTYTVKAILPTGKKGIEKFAFEVIEG